MQSNERFVEVKNEDIPSSCSQTLYEDVQYRHAAYLLWDIYTGLLFTPDLDMVFTSPFARDDDRLLQSHRSALRCLPPQGIIR